MSAVLLNLETGRRTGSPASRRLRRDDIIPGVVYGQGVVPTNVSVARRDLRLALTGAAGTNALLTIQFDGKSHPAVVKELQRDVVRRTVNHVDFLVVNLKETIEVEVHIVLIGEAKAVIAEGGLVDPQINSITISTTPDNIPTEITIDISDMGMGDSIKIGDLTLPAGCTTPLDPDQTVVAALETRGSRGETPEAPEADE